jgi:hypothetical protein
MLTPKAGILVCGVYGCSDHPYDELKNVCELTDIKAMVS